MSNNLYYSQSSGARDIRPGAGISLNPSPRGLTVGDERLINMPLNDPYHIDYDEDFEDEFDEEIDDIQYLLMKKTGQPRGSDSYGRRKDNAYFGAPGLSISEKISRYRKPSDKVHTTTARKGMTPFKQRGFDGPPIGGGAAGQAFRTTGNYFYSGTQFGTSRAPLPRHDEDDEPLLFDDELTDSMERAFKKQQNKIKKIHKVVDNLEKHEKTSYLSYEENKYKRNILEWGL